MATINPSARLNLAKHCIGRAAHTAPDKQALLVYTSITDDNPSETWTYADLEDAVLRLANGLLSLGLSPGDRIMIRLENTSDYAILFFAATAAGLIALPASNQLTDHEAEFLALDSGASLVASNSSFGIPPGTQRITSNDVREMIATASRGTYAPTTANDPAYLIYTSGTTAKPKGVLHAHRAIVGREPMYKGWYDITSADRMLHAGAFNWTFTLGTGLMDPWANGATSIVFTGVKTPELWPQLIRKTNATLFAAVPGLIRQILKYNDLSSEKMPSLRHALIAGEAPPPRLFSDWHDATGTRLYEALGMSELSTYISSSPNVPRKPGTTGKPQEGRNVAILPIAGGDNPLPPGEEGLIAVHKSDPGLMMRYWNRPDEEADVFRSDWFIGGDTGIMDDDGYITHTGRNNELMKALGYRVSPLEVEAALAEHPAIAEVACAEVAVKPDVHVIGAFIVSNVVPPPSADEILAFAAEHLADYKRPREVTFVESLPRTANGKVKRAALSECWQPRKS